MSSKDDIIDTEDALAMELDDPDAVDTTEGASRPATSEAASNISSVNGDDDDDDEDRNDHSFRPGSLPPPNTPLKDSYRWISPKPTAEGPYVVGVDEAGRGPALGPLVYGMAFCPVSFVEDHLSKMGFDVNLNTQSQNATIELLRALLAEPYSLPVTEVYVDALGPAEKYQAYLQSRFPTLSITVRNKADSLYKIVGAASVAAKVTRDFLVENWTWEEASAANNPRGLKGNAIWGKGSELGSGYPSDPNTKEWISSHLEMTFGFPSIARFSWAPIRTAMERGHKVQWIDEDQKTIAKSFEAISKKEKGRSFVTRELNISSVSSL
ncbi:hypothetical protein FRC17_002035 [Serendipita sp. 399]|nr:hypothetical protein FRC17_002035 [Serendipita sp. 399]